MTDGFTFLDPWMLVCIAPVTWCIWRSRRDLPAVRFAAATHAHAVRPTWRSRFHPVPSVLLYLGIVAACVALARPVHRSALPQRAIGIDILLCIDRSSSMAEPFGTTDDSTTRTRIDAASEAAIEFADARTSDRIGVVQFAEFADLVCPLTLDRVAVADVLRGLRALEPDDPEDRTGIGTACTRAAQVLEAGSEAPSKVVVLFTDGLENVATPENPIEVGPLEAAEVCRSLGVRVYVLAATGGVADEPARRGLSALKSLAETTGGTFDPVGVDAAADAHGELRRIFERIDDLERSDLEEPSFVTADAFEALVWLALALFTLGQALAVTVWRSLP